MPSIQIDGADAFDCASDDTIMRAAARAGLGFPYECNTGACGNCRFQLLEGEVVHLRADAPGWNERDRARGRYLGCQARPLGDCTIKVGLSPQYESSNRPRRQRARFVGAHQITHDIREFVFDLGAPSPFLPGQYALLALPGVEGARAYSMSNADGGDGVWRFQIRFTGGSGTTQLFDRIKEGADIEIDGPYGMAYLRPDAKRPIVCIAGGSGLSPMVSITRGAAAASLLDDAPLEFYYGGRQPADADIGGIFGALAKQVNFHPVVSEPLASDAAWAGETGFVHEVVRERLGERLKTCEIYFAGPPAMSMAVQKMLFELGVPPNQAHFDQFY